MINHIFLILVWAMLSTACGSIISSQKHIGPKERIAVLPLRNKAMAKKIELDYLTSVLRQAAGRLPRIRYSVMTKDNILVLLPPNRNVEDCLGTCAVDTGQRLGAHWVMVGEVLRFGQALRVTLNLHQTSTGQLISSETIKGKQLVDIEVPLEKTALAMFKRIDPSIKYEVSVSSEPTIMGSNPQSSTGMECPQDCQPACTSKCVQLFKKAERETKILSSPSKLQNQAQSSRLQTKRQITSNTENNLALDITSPKRVPMSSSVQADEITRTKLPKSSAYTVILSAGDKMVRANLVDSSQLFMKRKQGIKAEIANTGYVQKNDQFEPVPKVQIDPIILEFLVACKSYVNTYPSDKKTPSISFKAASFYIKAGHYEEGVALLELIMSYHSKHKFASFAAATLFDINYRMRRWDQMERWGRYMLKKRNFKVLKKKQLQDIIAISINNYAAELIEKGTNLEKEGKHDEGQKLQDKAVEQMLRFIDEFPKHEKAAIVLSNVAFLTEKTERIEKAVSLYERLIKTYKKSPQATEAHFVLGALYESQTRFDKAASYFEKMAAFPDLDDMNKIKDSLYNAGAIRMALQQYPQAIKIFQSFIKKFPKDKLTVDLYFNIARAYEVQKKWKQARKTYKKYIKKYKKTKKESLVRVYLSLAETHQKEGSRKARKYASKELDWAMKIYKSLDEKDQQDPKIKYAASKVRFLQAEYLLQDFLDYKIIAYPQRKLVKTLQKKSELQQKSEKVYLEVLEYKVFQVSAGAFYRIANIYNVFAKTLTNLEPPQELVDDPELLDIYQIFMEEKVLPLEEKAVESAKAALQLAHANRVYNQWSKKSAKLLATLSPELFPVLNDEVVNTDWLALSLKTNPPNTVIRDSLVLLTRDPRDLKALNLLSSAYLQKRDYKNCLKYIKEVLKIAPKNVTAILNLGLLYLDDKNLDLSELMFSKVLGYDARNAYAYANMGLLYYRVSKIPNAVRYFQKAIHLNQGLIEARMNLGSIYLDYLHYKSALEQFKFIVDRFPKHYEALIGYANSLYGVGQYDEAVKSYQNSLKLRKDNREVYLRLAKLYEEKMSDQADHKQIAVKYYDDYIRLFSPAKSDRVHIMLANLKAIIQMEKEQR